VLSWLLLRGRCRGCGNSISVLYPLVEIATAILWASAVAMFGTTPGAMRAAIASTLLLGIAITDARRFVIPHEFSLGGTLLAVLLAGWAPPPTLVESIIGALAGAGFVLLAGEIAEALMGQEAMGGGDCALMGMIGAFFGWFSIPAVLFLGAAISIVLHLVLEMVRRQRAFAAKTRTDHSPGSLRPGMLLRLLVPGLAFCALIVMAVSKGFLFDILMLTAHGVLGSGVTYYALLLLPSRLATVRALQFAGILGAGLGVIIGSSSSWGRLAIGVVILAGATWLKRAATIASAPATDQDLQKAGYLPYGVGLSVAAIILTFTNGHSKIQELIGEYAAWLETTHR
jgi:Flp pilus assembly protein protease CpaA